ncbi:hypothetical protein GCM10025858_20580 [Alicyclobacillus sacchari]|nr:hypothetical protein GCM10025858_20580 [Alicyclobacillus sacchari]
MQAFTQFGSDLDKATQDTLRRGERMTELLKQPQYQPLTFDRQVASLWTGVNGYLDDIPVEAVLKFERDWLAFLDREYPQVFAQMQERKSLEDDTVALLKEAIGKFKATFVA